MRLRTVTGTRWPAKCADGCGGTIEPDPNVKVVVDFESKPRKTWIPEHSPDAGTWKGNGSTAQPAPANGGNGHATGFTPASALPPQPQAQPKAPEPPAPPKTPAPVPLALSAMAGASEPAPSSNAGVAWATSQLTFNAGPYESAKSGFADYLQAGESPEQLRARVNRVVLEDIERQVRGIRELHERLGDTAIRTSSPARAAGAPPGGAFAAPSSPPLATARAPADTLAAAGGGRSLRGDERSSVPSSGNPSPPRSAGPPAPPAVEKASPGLSPQAVGVGGSGRSTAPPRADLAVADLVARVNLELTDASVRRKRAKEAAARKLCELRGLRSLRECTSSDEAALQALLVTMSAIDDWDLHSALGVPPPRLDDHLVLPA